jgi:hypothetical protein
MATEAEVQHVCVVCGEAAAAALTAECNWCDGRYHLNQRNDVEGKDCGEVWIDEQFLALQFACYGCLRGDDAQIPARTPVDRDPPRARRYKRRS